MSTSGIQDGVTNLPPEQSVTAAPSREDSVRLRQQAKQRSRVGSVVYHLVMLVMVAIVLYPALWMFMSSLRPSSEIVGNVSLIPREGTVRNYITIMDGIGGVSTWTFFANSMILAVLSVVGVVLSSAVTAYAFARLRFKGHGLWFGIMIGTMLLPFHVVIIPQYILFNTLGMINTFWPLLLGKFLAAEAFFVFLVVQFMRGIPRELDEAASIDGAGYFRVFATVILPLTKPALLTAGIFTFINAWNDFLGPLLYLKRPDLYTLPVAMRLFVDQTTTSDYGAQIAMAVFALIPVLIFFFIFQRYLVEGVSTSGLKG